MSQCVSTGFSLMWNGVFWKIISWHWSRKCFNWKISDRNSSFGWSISCIRSSWCNFIKFLGKKLNIIDYCSSGITVKSRSWGALRNTWKGLSKNNIFWRLKILSTFCLGSSHSGSNIELKNWYWNFWLKLLKDIWCRKSLWSFQKVWLWFRKN